MKLDGLVQQGKQAALALQSGKLVVLRTDTLYGIVARADDPVAVERLQRVRKREPGKAFIVLIPEPSAAYGDDAEKVARAYSAVNDTHPTSIIIEHSVAPRHLLHRDGSLAYRVPRDERIQALLALAGPVVAPSANVAGAAPARSIDEAKVYFGDEVALYIDDGTTPDDQQPSTVIRVSETGEITRIR
jgi:L-threonylcarbamoyladenylate synthase